MRASIIIRRSLAEALGTFILVFVGAGTVTAVALYFRVPGISLLLVALGLGLALFVGMTVVGKVSGGHLNPAITVGLAVARRFEWADVPGYIIGQVVGAVLGAACIVLVSGTIGARIAGLGAPTLSLGTSIWQGMIIEGLGTAMLVLAFIASAVDTRAVAGWAPLAVGLALVVVILFIGVATSGSVNPARAFGPDLLAMFFGFPVDWAAFVVAYLIGPLLGGIGAAFLYTAVVGLPHPSTEAAVDGPRPQAAEAPKELPDSGDFPQGTGIPAA